MHSWHVGRSGRSVKRRRTYSCYHSGYEEQTTRYLSDGWKRRVDKKKRQIENTRSRDADCDKIVKLFHCLYLFIGPPWNHVNLLGLFLFFSACALVLSISFCLPYPRCLCLDVIMSAMSCHAMVVSSFSCSFASKGWDDCRK